MFARRAYYQVPLRLYSVSADTSKLKDWTKHPQLIKWIEEQVRLCQPDKIHLCDGSEEEFQKYAH